MITKLSGISINAHANTRTQRHAYKQLLLQKIPQSLPEHGPPPTGQIKPRQRRSGGEQARRTNGLLLLSFFPCPTPGTDREAHQLSGLPGLHGHHFIFMCFHLLSREMEGAHISNTSPPPPLPTRLPPSIPCAHANGISTVPACPLCLCDPLASQTKKYRHAEHSTNLL